jgi:hypothetical protein
MIFTACENDMEFNGDARDPKLNMQAIVSPVADGASHYIKFSESVFVWGDRKPQPVNGATFIITRNGIEIPVETTPDEERGRGQYRFSSPLVTGDRFNLEGWSPLHGKISASTVVPAPADIRDMKIEMFTRNSNAGMFFPGNSGNTHYARALVTIADPTGEKNFYAVRMYSITHYLTKNSEWDSVTETNVSVIERIDSEEERMVLTDDEILFDNLDGNPIGIQSWSQFSDELIDGSEYTLNVYAQITPEGHGFDFVPDDHQLGTWILGKSVRVEVLTLSPGFFQYMRSAELARNQQNNSFAEPVQVYSNVAGGYGILGAYNVASKTAELEVLPE